MMMHLQDTNDNSALMGAIKGSIMESNSGNAADPTERTYDDPCELLDGSGIAERDSRIPRSRSWLCCPQSGADGNNSTGGGNTVPLPCRYSSLQPVTVPPRPQDHLHLAAMSALKAEVLDLSAQLQICSRERDRFQAKLKIEQEERSRAQVRLEALGTAHEGRLTELHCVIAELSRKLHQRQQAAIMEEEAEADISEIESSSVCDANETDTNKDESDVEENKCSRSMTQSPSALPRPEFTAMITSQHHQQPFSNASQMSKSQNYGSPMLTKTQHQPSATQMAALQEEILSLRQEVAHLQAQLATKRNYESSCHEYVEDSVTGDIDKDTEDNSKRSNNTYTSEHDLDETLPLGRLTGTLNDVSCIEDNNGDEFSDSDKNEYMLVHDNSARDGSSPVKSGSNERQTDPDFVNKDEDSEEKRIVGNGGRSKHAKSNSLVLQIDRSSSPVHVHSSLGRTNRGAPISKMAERVRLRRTTDEKHITGSDITNTGVCTTEVAEHLVSDMRNRSGLHESFLMTDSLNGSASSGTTPSEVLRLELELERTIARLEHMRANNTVLTLTLQESKAHCDRMALLCGRYESNATALQVALNYSDRTVEAYDVLLALLESQAAIAKAENDPELESAKESRRTAETVAKHLLARLQAEGGTQIVSTGPWQDAKTLYSNSAVTSEPWCATDESELRAMMSRLKAERSNVQGTVVVLECLHAVDIVEPRLKGQQIRRLDLETAVLMQELMAMREERADLRSQVFASERERKATELRFSALEASYRAAQAALQHLQGQLADTEALLSLARQNKDRSSYSETEHAAGVERELLDALAREARLKSRLQSLAGSLEAAAKTTEDRHVQAQNAMLELKETNINLNLCLERCKRKYQNRVRKLEQQLLGLEQMDHSIGSTNAHGRVKCISPMQQTIQRGPETIL